MSLYTDRTAERLLFGDETIEREGLDLLFDESLAVIAEDSPEKMQGAIEELLKGTLGYSEDTAALVASAFMNDIPAPRQPESGVRIIKPAEPTLLQREKLALRLTAYVVTADDGNVSPGAALEWSKRACEMAAVLLYNQDPQLGHKRCDEQALDHYQTILLGYLDSAVVGMAESTTTEGFQAWYGRAALISQLQADVKEVCTQLISQGASPAEPAASALAA